MQALMALLQQQGMGSLAGAASGTQPALYANPYNPQGQTAQSALDQYAGYDAASQAAAAAWSGSAASQAAAASNYASAYGNAPASPSQTGSSAGSQGSATSNTYSAAPSLYSTAAQNPFPGAADVLSSLRALAGAYGGGFAGAAGYGAAGGFGAHAPGTSNCYKCGQVPYSFLFLLLFPLFSPFFSSFLFSNCFKAGHFARECPNAPADGAVLCYRCGQVHFFSLQTIICKFLIIFVEWPHGKRVYKSPNGWGCCRDRVVL